MKIINIACGIASIIGFIDFCFTGNLAVGIGSIWCLIAYSL